MQKLFITIFLVSALSISSCSNKSNSGNKHNSIIQEKGTQLLSSNPKDLIVYTDSLLKTDSNTLDNETLILVYEFKQKAYSSLKRMDSVLITGEKIREIASKIPDSLAIANSLLLIKGTFDFSHLKETEIFFPGSINTFEKYNMPYEKALLENLYSVILTQNGDFVKSQKLLLDAYEILIKLDSTRVLTNVCINLAMNYDKSNSDPQKALEYYNKAYAISVRVKDTVKQAAVLMNIGLFYDQPGKDSSDYFYSKALELLSNDERDNILKMKLQFNIASYYFDRGKKNQAEDIYNSLIKYGTKYHAIEMVAYAKAALSDINGKSGQFPKAIEQLTSAIKIMDTLGMKNEMMIKYNQLIQLYDKSGNIREALKATIIYNNLKDSIMGVEKQIAVSELEKKYQFEKKELENGLLKSQLSYFKIFILILTLLFGIVFYLYRQKVLLSRDRKLSYDTLMLKYKEEKRQRAIQISHSDKEIIEGQNQEAILLNKLNEYYTVQKPYLNQRLKVEDVTTYLNTTQKELFQALKMHNFSNFNTYTNKFRVEEARRLFENPNYENVKLESIAIESGFGSKTSFYAAFELFTGMKPGYYRSKINT